MDEVFPADGLQKNQLPLDDQRQEKNKNGDKGGEEEQRQEIDVAQRYLEGRTDGRPAENGEERIDICLPLWLHAAKMNVFF